jgi:hypothetical protein
MMVAAIHVGDISRRDDAAENVVRGVFARAQNMD